MNKEELEAMGLVEPICTYDPTHLKWQPIGMFHCPECGCMVLAGKEHGLCFEDSCWLLNSSENP